MFLKALGPFLACVIGIVVVVAGKWTNGKGPIKACVHAGCGLLLLLGVLQHRRWLQHVRPACVAGTLGICSACS
jgi:hypothetical protein